MNLLQSVLLTRMPHPTTEGGTADPYGVAIAAISGLVSWWRWSETSGDVAVDEQGVQNGVYQGGVTLNHDALMANTTNTGMRLDGTTGFVEIADKAAFHLGNGTLALWFQADSLISDRYLLSKFASGIVLGNLELNYRAADNTFRFRLDDGTNVQRAMAGAVLPSGVLQINNTYCVVIQWGSGGMKLHLGVAGARSLIGTNAYTGGLANNTMPLRVGAGQWSGAASQHFDGGIDDLILWNRALSDAELDVVMQATTTAAPPGLIDFVNNNSTMYYSIPHASTLDFPAGVGGWGFWTRVDENTGEGAQFVLSSGVPGTLSSLNVYLAEASNVGTTANAFGFTMTDSAGVGGSTLRPSSTITGADGIERLVIVQSTGSLVQMWLCPKNGTATKVYEASVALGALVPTTDWNLGRRADGDTARYWEEWLGGPFKFNTALSQAEIEEIATGVSPIDVIGSNCVAFWRFANGAVAIELDVVNGLAATKLSASVPTGVTGFYKVPNTANTKIPAGWPTLAARPSTTVSGQTCTSAEFVADIETAVHLAKPAYAGEFMSIKCMGDWGWPIRFASTSDPVVTFSASGSRYARPEQWDHYIANGWNVLRWPAGARPMTGADKEIGIVDPSRTYITEFFLCNYPTLTTAKLRKLPLNQVPYKQPNDGMGWASLCPMAKTATAIRYQELAVDHVIPHAIAFAYPYPADSVVSGNNSLFPCVIPINHFGTRVCACFNGMRFQLDPTVNRVTACAGVDARYRNSCEVILLAMQEYGLFLVDGSNTPSIYAEGLAGQVGETRSWQDPALEAAGYALPVGTYNVLKGAVDWTKLRAIEPIIP